MQRIPANQLHQQTQATRIKPEETNPPLSSSRVPLIGQQQHIKKGFRKPIRNVLMSKFQTKRRNQPTNRRRNNLGMPRIGSRPAHGEIDARELTME